jgi:hypothetical protein
LLAGDQAALHSCSVGLSGADIAAIVTAANKRTDDFDYLLAHMRYTGVARLNHSAPRIAASKEGVPAIFGGVISFDLIDSFAPNRTKPNMKFIAASVLLGRDSNLRLVSPFGM